MPPFAGAQRLDDERVARRHRRPARLQLDQRAGELHLRRGVVAGERLFQFTQRGIGKLCRQRHLGAGPARHRAAATPGRLHVRRHFVDADQFQQAPAEHEGISLAQPRDERFLDRADVASVHHLHQHRRVGDDGADRHAMALGDAPVGHAIDALGVAYDPVVLRVGAQRLAAAADEVERPREFLVGQLAIAPRGTNFRQHRVVAETGAQSERDQVLHQHVERLFRCATRLDAAGRDGAARCRRLDELQRVRRHDRHARRPARRMTAAARALQQACDALGAADLQHALHRQEVHAQIEAGRRHDGFQPAVLQAALHPLARLPCRVTHGGARSRRPTSAARPAATGTRFRPASAYW